MSDASMSQAMSKADGGPGRRRPGVATAGTQRGIGLLGLLLLAAVLVVAAVVGMQVLPTATEYVAVKRAVKRAVDGADTVGQVRAAFDRFAAIDDIKSVAGRDLDVERDASGKMVASFRYTRRIELVGPASLLLEYQGSSAER